MISRFSLIAITAAGVLAAISPASAQGLHHATRRAYPASNYYQLPTVVRLTPGQARILGPRRCDRAYPMDESMACGTATGGPVGGRGS